MTRAHSGTQCRSGVCFAQSVFDSIEQPDLMQDPAVASLVLSHLIRIEDAAAQMGPARGMRGKLIFGFKVVIRLVFVGLDHAVEVGRQPSFQVFISASGRPVKDGVLMRHMRHP